MTFTLATTIDSEASARAGEGGATLFVRDDERGLGIYPSTYTRNIRILAFAEPHPILRMSQKHLIILLRARFSFGTCRSRAVPPFLCKMRIGLWVISNNADSEKWGRGPS